MEEDYELLKLQYAKIVGEYTGFMKAVLTWPLPDDAKIKLEKKYSELLKLREWGNWD